MIKNYAVFTYSGEGLPVAKHLIDKRENVLVGQVQDIKDILIKSEQYKPEDPDERGRRLTLYDGMLEKHDAWKLVEYLKTIKNKDEWFLLFDFNYLFRFAKELSGLGFHGNFPVEKDREFEVDREKAKNFVKKYYPKIKVAEVHEFKTMEEAKNFLENTDKLWVLKGKSDETKTIVPDVNDPELVKDQILSALESDKGRYEKDGFILEQKILNPLELTPQKAYYNGKPIFTDLDIENKTIGSGNIGMLTGCSQDLVFETEMNEKINQISFPKIVDEIAKLHKGLFMWDISLLIDPSNDEIYMGEFCPNRYGYNAFYTELAHFDNIYEFFNEIIKGRNPYNLSVAKFATSIRLFDFHRAKGEAEVGVKMSWSEETGNDLWLLNAKQEPKTKEIITAGYYYRPEYVDIGVITGFGETIKESVEKMWMYFKGFSMIEIYTRPNFDFLSLAYPTSILNRYNYYIKNFK